MSWIQNEVSKENQAHQYIELEYEIPLFLRPEVKDARTLYYDWLNRTLYYDWLKIAYSKPRIWIIPPLREATYQEYTTMAEKNLLATKQGNQWCWIELSEDLQKKEPHSLLNFIMATWQAPWYVKLGEERKSDWIPLIFQPPLLLSPLLANKQDLEKFDMIEELHRYERYMESKGFYWNISIGGKGQSIPLDFRMAARVKNFMFS